MLRFLAAAALLSAPAAAAHYRAQPAAAPTAERIILGEQVWKRAGASYEAGAGGSRPAIVCARLAKEVGMLSRFEVAGAPIAETDLARCNARAAR